MPLRAASTRTARAPPAGRRAVALMTAVTPPLWAYSGLPAGVHLSESRTPGRSPGLLGTNTVSWPATKAAV